MLKIFYFKQGVFRWFSPLSPSKSSLTLFTLLPALFLSVGLSPWQVISCWKRCLFMSTPVQYHLLAYKNNLNFVHASFNCIFCSFPGCLSLSASWFPPAERNFATSVVFWLSNFSFYLSVPPLSLDLISFIFLGWSDVQRSWSRLFLCPLFPHPSWSRWDTIRGKQKWPIIIIIIIMIIIKGWDIIGEGRKWHRLFKLDSHPPRSQSGLWIQAFVISLKPLKFALLTIIGIFFIFTRKYSQTNSLDNCHQGRLLQLPDDTSVRSRRHPKLLLLVFFVIFVLKIMKISKSELKIL